MLVNQYRPLAMEWARMMDKTLKIKTSREITFGCDRISSAQHLYTKRGQTKETQKLNLDKRN